MRWNQRKSLCEITPNHGLPRLERRRIPAEGRGDGARNPLYAIPVLILTAFIAQACIAETQAVRRPTTAAKTEHLAAATPQHVTSAEYAAQSVEATGQCKPASKEPSDYETTVLGIPPYEITVVDRCHYTPVDSSQSPLYSLSGRPDHSFYAPR